MNGKEKPYKFELVCDFRRELPLLSMKNISVNIGGSNDVIYA